MQTETRQEEVEPGALSRPGTHLTLTERSAIRHLYFGVLYMAQGLPPGLMSIAFPAWLAEQDVGTAEIGAFLAITSLAWALKVVLGPLMDRFGFLPMGRRRPWILGAQLGLLISFTMISFVTDPARNLHQVIIIGFAVSFFVALQDVAVDGLAIDVIPIGERARANGFMWGGKTLGLALGASGGGVILGRNGYQAAVLAVVVLLGFITLFALLLRERPGERLLPWTQGKASEMAIRLQLHDWRSILRGLLRVLFLPASVMTILVTLVFMFELGILRTMLPVLSVQELGWSHTEFSHLYAIAGIIACIAGMLFSATVIDRWGQVRTFAIIVVLLLAVKVITGLTIAVWATRTPFVGFLIIVSIINFIGTVTILAMLMNLCWKRVAATQFALYMAVANVGVSAGAALVGPLDAVFEYAHIFLLIAVVSVLLLVLLRFVNLNAHQERLEGLDSKTQQSY